jgi:hypothetical protein
LLILGGDFPGLVAVTPASAAAATSACAMTDLGLPGGIQSATHAINDNDQSSPAAPAPKARSAFLLTSSY